MTMNVAGPRAGARGFGLVMGPSAIPGSPSSLWRPGWQTDDGGGRGQGAGGGDDAVDYGHSSSGRGDDDEPTIWDTAFGARRLPGAASPAGAPAPVAARSRKVRVMGLALVSNDFLRDGMELFLDYRLNPGRPRPPWYVACDPEAEERLWRHRGRAAVE